MTNIISSDNYLSISAFSDLSGISRQNLIYYDTVDVLKPFIVKDNGYRYYSYEQLEEVSIILTLKDLDFSLKEIKTYLKNISPENLLQLINKQKQKISEELNRLNQMDFIIEQRSIHAAISVSIDCSKPVLEECEEELLFLGPVQEFDNNSIEKDFDSFLAFSKKNKLIYGYPLGIWACYKDIIAGQNGKYGYFYKISPTIKAVKTIKPAGLYVIGYDNSYLAGELEIFKPMDQFIRNHNLSPCGNVYIENIADEINTSNPCQYLSKISVQVKG